MNSWDVRVFGPAVANLPRTKSTRTAYPAPSFSVWGCFPCYLQHFGPDRSYFPVFAAFWTLNLSFASLQHFGARTCNLHGFVCSMFKLKSLLYKNIQKPQTLKAKRGIGLEAEKRLWKGHYLYNLEENATCSCCYVVSLYFSSCCRQNICSILAIESVFALYVFAVFSLVK